MARYRTFLYNGDKYGAGLLETTLFWAVEIDWDNDGAFDGTNEARRVRSIAVTRGRSDFMKVGADGQGGFGRAQVGEVTLTLDNYDRRYDPWYAAGPLYGNLLPGRDVKIRIGYVGYIAPYFGAIISSVFRGKISDIVISQDRSDPICTIKVVDGWQLLSDARSTIELQTDATSDLLIDAVLDDVGWPSAWGTDLDTGSDTIPYAWADDRDAFGVLHDIAESEMGLVYVGADGKFYFVNRHNLLLAASSVTVSESEVGNDPEISNPWEYIRNIVRVQANPRALGSETEIWRLDEIRLLTPGQSITVWGSFRDSNYNLTIAQDVVEPVATTDYTMNTDSAGGGTDLTASFTVTATIFAGSVKFVITNGHATLAGYITLLKVRGKPLELLNVAAAISEDTSSQAIYGKRELKLDLPFQQNTNVATDLADWIITWIASAQPVLVIEIINRPVLQFYYDLGTLITFQGAYMGVDQTFRIGQITHESMETMQAIRTRLVLEPVPAAVAYWQLGTAGYSELGTTTRLAY